MTVPYIFATQAAGNVPASYLDANFAQLVELAGGNTILGKNTFSDSLSGTSTAGSVHLLGVSLSETVTDLTASSTVDGLYISHIFGTGQAARNGIRVDLNNAAATAGVSADQHAFYTGIMSNLYIAYSDGGGVGTEKGDFYGYAAQVTFAAGATNMHGIVGAEFDIGCQAGSSLISKIGLQVLSYASDAVKGSAIDALVLITADSSTTAKFDYGIVFGKAGTNWPVSGTLIGTYATLNTRAAVNGIDFSAVTFSGSAFKSAGFSVTTSLVSIDGLAAGNNAQLTVANAGVNGGAVQITDGTNGKFLRVLSNTFQIINSAYTGALLSLTDAGNFSVAGTTNYLGTTTSAADAMVATPSPVLTAYTAGAFYIAKSGYTNATTTPTINVSGLGAKTIVKRAATALAAGDYVANMMMILVYDGTNMELLNPVVN